MPNESFWIMRPFNALLLITFALFLALLVIASLLLRGKSSRVKETVLVVACLVTLVGYFIYKYLLSKDTSYNEITAVMGGFNWWGELPIQLCNINMIIIPIAVLKKSRPLMCFAFFLGPLGALMALVMPGNGFSGYSLLLPRMLGYFGTHFMIVIEGLALATFGLLRPKYRDIPRTLIASVLILLVVLAINLLLRWSGLHPKSNSMFMMETENNPLLELFYSWIPVPCLYLLPSFVILSVYMLLVTTGFTLADRKKAKEEI